MRKFGTAMLPGTLAACFALALPSTAQDSNSIVPPESVAALNAQASKLDPEDYKFVQQVCTVCHTPAMFLHARSWREWSGVFDQMSSYGAQGSKEQWDHIAKYFQQGLTLIDVNSADEDLLSLILGVDEKTAIAIVVRRSTQKFTSAADLETVPGIDKARVEQIKPRMSFDGRGFDTGE